MTGTMMVARVFSILMILCSAAYAAPKEDPCIKCHEKQTPGIVSTWMASAHFGARVLCADCHGTDIEASHNGTVRVLSVRCGGCHKEQLAQQGLGKHSMGLKSGGGCTRAMPQSAERERSCVLCHTPGSTEPFVEVSCAMFLAQSPEMQRQGCSTCHKVETGCDACHTKHSTDLKIAADARTCGMCHMGPDHPQYEAWASSMHGVLYQNSVPGLPAPTCATCHMEAGSHNVSTGIATGRPPETRKDEREIMLNRCTGCHAGSFAKRSLDDADKIFLQGKSLVDEANGIVAGLSADGLLEPKPEDRPAHPLKGKSLVIDSHMIYENLSGPEALYFRLSRFYFPIMFKAAFHQSPDYAHWFGNAMLKLAVSELKGDAAGLRDARRLRLRLDNLSTSQPKEAVSPALRDRLRALKDRFLKGEITETEYSRKTAELLDEHGY